MIEKRFNLGMKGSLIKSLLQRLLPGGEIDTTMSNKANTTAALCYIDHWQTTQVKAAELLRSVVFTRPFSVTANLWATDVWAGETHKPPAQAAATYTVYVTQSGPGVAQLWIGCAGMYSIVSDGTSWDSNGWVSYTTATPPQPYLVPLEGGWQRISGTYYRKTQDGKVIIGLMIGRGGAAIPAGQYGVGTMPVGYRPAPDDDATGVGTDASEVGYQGLSVQMWVLPGGGIGVRIPADIPASPTAGVVGTISYWAAS